MSALGQALDTLKKVLLLQEEVTRLGKNTAKLAEKLDAVHTSVTKLEARQENAIQLAQQEARLAVTGELNEIRDRLIKIELFITAAASRGAGQPAAPPILISQSPSDPPPKSGTRKPKVQKTKPPTDGPA
jgi:hypothetical protein